MTRRKQPDRAEAGTARVGESQTTPAAPAGFAARATDLQSLRDAVVDAAGIGTGLWFTYLSLLVYLALSAATVTHRDLLLERPVTLPLLNAELPPIGFFMLGPGLLLILHAYVLLHLALLSGKIGLFHSELDAQVADERLRERLRAQLPSNVFVQLLAGTREVRTSIMGFMMRSIAYISLVAAPLAILILFQLQFLPYHHEATTSWQRLAVIVDIAILWSLWPSVASGKTTWIAWRDLRRPRIATLALASFAVMLLPVTILTFPGETLHSKLPALRFIPVRSAPESSGYSVVGWTSLHNLLVGGEVDDISRRPTSIWSNRLILPYFDPIDHVKYDTDAKAAAVAKLLSLRGRRLEGAIFTSARLAKIDFTGARMKGARLIGAELSGANFDQADLREASLDYQDLRGVSLSGTNLSGATLQMASLTGVTLVGSSLAGATLDGAYLFRANLSYSNLTGASLRGASLFGANLQKTILDGAWLNGADLMAADLTDVSLVGASLDNALLLGATLETSRIYGASLDRVFLWRATPHRHVHVPEGHIPDPPGSGPDPARDPGPPPYEHPARLVSPVYEAKYAGWVCPEGSTCEWKASSDDVNKWLADSFGETEYGRDQIRERFARLDTSAPQPMPDPKDFWVELEQQSPPREAYDTALEPVLRWVGCAADGAPYVLRGMLPHLDERFRPDVDVDLTSGVNAHLIALATSFLDDATCPGARGLLPGDRDLLQAILSRSHASAPGTTM